MLCPDLRAAWLASVLIILATACLVDEDEPCDHNRVELKGTITGCICAPGTVPAPDNASCVACAGEHEEASGGVCQCSDGYVRMGGACVLMVDAGRNDGEADSGPTAPSGQDEPCSSQDGCAGYDADFCLPFPGTQTCAVRNCADGMQTCSADLVCCDVSGAASVFPDLTKANGICVSSAACAMGGREVNP